MPEITDAELRQFVAYQAFGTPAEITTKIASLVKDNGKQRDEIRDFKELVPKEGEVVLPKSEADKLKKYIELGKVDEVKGKLQTGGEAELELTTFRRKEAAVAFAEAAGLAKEAVDTLIAIPDLVNAAFEVKKGTVKVNGQDVEAMIPSIVLPGENGATETVKFTDAQERFPALKGLRLATKEEGGKPTPLPFTPTGGAPTGGAPGNIYDTIREQRKAEAEKPANVAASKGLEERLGMTKAP